MIPNNVKGNGFRGALNYVFDVGVKDSLKHPEIVASNMASTNPRDLAAEFGLVRRLHERAKNPVFHCSLSFAIGENPPREVLDQIPELFLNKMGKRAMQGEIGISTDHNPYVAVIHQDKDHLHLHLIASRIRYDGKVCYMKWDKKNAQAACREIEQELGLVEVTGQSSRLFLDGRLIARLEKQEKKTGVTDPRLERYRQERTARLEEIQDEQLTGRIRPDYGSMSQRDSAGSTGTEVREATEGTDSDPDFPHSSQHHNAGGLGSTGGRISQQLNQFEQQLNQFGQQFEGTVEGAAKESARAVNEAYRRTRIEEQSAGRQNQRSPLHPKRQSGESR